MVRALEIKAEYVRGLLEKYGVPKKGERRHEIVGEEREFFARLKMTAILHDWANEVPVDDICDRYGTEPGDLHEFKERATRLLHAAKEIAKLGGKDALAGRLEVLSRRVKHGVKAELLPLVEALDMIGRVRARRLYDAGYRTPNDLVKATIDELAKVPSIGPKIVESIKEQLSGRVRAPEPKPVLPKVDEPKVAQEPSVEGATQERETEERASPERYEIGDYAIVRDKEGFHVRKSDREIGSFAEGKVLEEENRALFELDKGMLLEVTPEGHRQIFTREKAGLHGYACADGNLHCGGYWGHRRGKWGWRYRYQIELSEDDPAVRAVFGRYLERVYDITAHDYPKREKIYGYGKDMAYDLSKYGPINTYEWRVPIEHLDKEGARCWLRAYFTGDGTVYIGKKPKYDEVRVSSVNELGIEEVRSLLDEHFSIESHLRFHGHVKSKAAENWSDSYDLRIHGKNIRKFRDEIGFDSPEKQRKVDFIARRRRGE